MFSGYIAPSVPFTYYTKWLKILRPENTFIALNHYLPKMFDNSSDVDRNLRSWQLLSTAFDEAFMSL